MQEKMRCLLKKKWKQKMEKEREGQLLSFWCVCVCLAIVTHAYWRGECKVVERYKEKQHKKTGKTSAVDIDSMTSTAPH